ncbi:MAG: hypothetical protein ACKO0W_00155 [Planctomycetota bacterium]
MNPSWQTIAAERRFSEFRRHPQQKLDRHERPPGRSDNRTAQEAITLHLLLGIAALGLDYAATTNWSRSRVMTGEFIVESKSKTYTLDRLRASSSSSRIRSRHATRTARSSFFRSKE